MESREKSPDQQSYRYGRRDKSVKLISTVAAPPPKPPFQTHTWSSVDRDPLTSRKNFQSPNYIPGTKTFLWSLVYFTRIVYTSYRSTPPNQIPDPPGNIKSATIIFFSSEGCPPLPFFDKTDKSKSGCCVTFSSGHNCA